MNTPNTDIIRFLKVVNYFGKTVLIQISNITSICESSDGEHTIINMIDPNDCMTFKISIKQVENIICANFPNSILPIQI